MTDKDKTVGGRDVANLIVSEARNGVFPHSAFGYSLLRDRIETALTDAHSRGLRDGLERAEPLARLVEDAIRCVEAYRTKPGGMGANILTEDRGRFSTVRARIVLERFRAEASKLDGAEQTSAYRSCCGVPSSEPCIDWHDHPAPEPPAEERAVMQCAGCQGPLADCVCGSSRA